jgi:hypothetical protein
MVYGIYPKLSINFTDYVEILITYTFSIVSTSTILSINNFNVTSTTLFNKNNADHQPVINFPAWEPAGAGALHRRLLKATGPTSSSSTRVFIPPLEPLVRSTPRQQDTWVDCTAPHDTARRAWNALKPPICCSPPRMKMGFDPLVSSCHS